MPFNTRPLRPVSAEGSASYARDGVVCLRNVFDTEWQPSMEGPARRVLIDTADFGLPPHPNGEAMRADPAYVGRFLTWEMAVGDDVHWSPRPDCLNIAGVSFDEIVEGEASSGDLLPLLWHADGRRDDDGRYPRGFPTTWAGNRRDEVNEYGTFETLQAAMRTA